MKIIDTSTARKDCEYLLKCRREIANRRWKQHAPQEGDNTHDMVDLNGR